MYEMYKLRANYCLPITLYNLSIIEFIDSKCKGKTQRRIIFSKFFFSCFSIENWCIRHDSLQISNEGWWMAVAAD